MMSKYFGTDGFRGEANVNLTVDHAFHVGRFLGWYYSQDHQAQIVIGKDTRRSSYMFECALAAGITASGADACLMHVTTTPSVSYISKVDEFDCGIIEKANSPTSPKNYKDHTWKCIQQSDDPPLKIIRGQLLGFQGIINEIAERFLRNNFHQIWEKQTSLQTPVGTDDENSGTLEDVFEDKSVVPLGSQLDKTDEDLLRQCFQNLLPNDNAAIFLVYLTGFSTLFRRKISIAIPELQEFVGLSSSSPLYDRLNNVILPKIQTLPKECLQAMSASGASDFLIFLMIEQIKPEKKASPFLQRVADGMSNSIGEETENE